MNISIKNYLKTKAIEGDIILYRDKTHKKKEMCQFLARHIETNKTICVCSVGAFGLYIAKAFPNHQVVICGHVSEEYKQQIEKLSNTMIVEKRGSAETKIYAEQNDYYYINQYNEPLIQNYYTQHFYDILLEVGQVDAFCDCGHSCATLAGIIENGANLEFILGVNRLEGNRINIHYLKNLTDKFVQETTYNFDIKQIQEEIESMYSDFGNVFEATHSISAAMSWLQKNPGKTVLVYVGDSPIFGEDATI